MRALLDEHPSPGCVLRAALGSQVQIEPVETNIVLIRQAQVPASDLVGMLAERGVRVLATGPDEIRAVTCMRVDADAIHYVAAIIGTTITGAG